MTTPFQGRLRIRHLEIVLAVAEQGNLSKAATQLDMTQSGLSRAIIDIEESVQGLLFERSAKGMKPTPLGESLCKHALRLLNDFRKAEVELSAISRGDLGSISIGCFSMFSSWPLPEALRRFRAASPRVTISVEIGTHEYLLEALNSGALDLLISRSPPGLNPESYRSTALLTDRTILASSVSHPLAALPAVSLKECVRHPWISALPESRIRLELESKLLKQGHELPASIGALCVDFTLEMISQNDYLCLLPASVAQVFHARGMLHILPVDLGLTPSPLSVIVRRDRPSSPHVHALSSILSEITENRSVFSSSMI